MTASTLYEAVEPHAIWKQLFISVRAELLAENSSGEVNTLSPDCFTMVLTSGNRR
jgi:hypothetical protein